MTEKIERRDHHIVLTEREWNAIIHALMNVGWWHVLKEIRRRLEIEVTHD